MEVEENGEPVERRNKVGKRTYGEQRWRSTTGSIGGISFGRERRPLEVIRLPPARKSGAYSQMSVPLPQAAARLQRRRPRAC